MVYAVLGQKVYKTTENKLFENEKFQECLLVVKICYSLLRIYLAPKWMNTWKDWRICAYPTEFCQYFQVWQCSEANVFLIWITPFSK